MPLHAKTMTVVEKSGSKPHDHRRSNKPIMEKRRRARINHCLGELKGLILEAMKKDPARHSKLEKADILEMTVKHLQNLQRHQMAIAVATDPTVMTKFRSGFNECATEVARYVNRIDGVDRTIRQRLVNHLRHCITGLNHVNPATFACLLPGIGPGGATAPPFMSPVQPMHIPSAAAALNVFSQQVPFGGDLKSGPANSRVVGGLNLIPSRLPNGDIAFVLPNQKHLQQHPQKQTLLNAPLASTPDSTDAASTVLRPSNSQQAHLPPAFATHPGMPNAVSATVTSAAPNERRTPSAFTPLVGAVPPRVQLPLVGMQIPLLANQAPPLGVVPPRLTSPAGACTVTSTTSPGNASGKVIFSPVSRNFTDATPPHQVKKDKKDEARHRGTCTIGPLPLNSEKSKVIKETATIVSTIPKDETAAITNQMEAYDLSKPSMSNVCSSPLTEAEKMWRPW